MVGIGREQGFEIANRFFVVTRGVLGIAKPKACRRGVATAWVGFGEVAEGLHSFREFTGTEHLQGGIEIALFCWIGLELLAIQGDLHGFKLAQTFVYALRNVFLAALQLGYFALKLFVLSSQFGLFGAQHLDLILQFEQTAPQLRGVVTTALAAVG